MSQDQPSDLSPIETLIRTRPWQEVLDRLREKQWDRDAPRWIDIAQREAGLRFDDEQRLWHQELCTLKNAPAVTALVRTLALPPRAPAALFKMLAQFETLDPARIPPLTRFALRDLGNPEHEVIFDTGAAKIIWALLAHTPLRAVAMKRNPRNEPVFQGILESPALRTVETLDLKHVDPAFLEALAHAPTLGSVRALQLSMTGPSPTRPASWAPIFARSVRELSLEVAAASRGSDDALFAQPWPELEKLRLDYLQPGDEFLASIFAQSPKLEVLQLHHCRLPPSAVAAVMQQAPVARLASLSQSDNDITDASFAELLRSPVCSKLTQLCLWEKSDVGPQTLAAIAALGSLESLVFWSSPKWSPEVLALREQINARAKARSEG